MPISYLAFQLQHISRHYSMGLATVRAVDDLSLPINQNEFLALLGPSGSGKSTLLHVMGGLESSHLRFDSSPRQEYRRAFPARPGPVSLQ